MLKKYFSAILFILALFVITETSSSQSLSFGISTGNGPRHHYSQPHPYYYPGYVYHKPHYHRYYHPQKRFYKHKVYRHDNGHHKGWNKQKKGHGRHKK